jgi:hypothetical protein
MAPPDATTALAISGHSVSTTEGGDGMAKRWQYGKSGWFLLDFREAIVD